MSKSQIKMYYDYVRGGWDKHMTFEMFEALRSVRC